MTAPDPVQLLREAGVEVPPEVSRWVRWREQVEHSCLTGSSETGWNEIHCCDCEFGPSCDEGDHYPPFLALAELVAKYKWQRDQMTEVALGERIAHYSHPLPPEDGGPVIEDAYQWKNALCVSLDRRWEQHRGK
jgi:hypothetical protein